MQEMSALQQWYDLAADDRQRYMMKMAVEGFISDEIRPTLKVFNEVVWRGGMYDRIQENNGGGMSGQYQQTRLMVFEIAGRVMLTFRGDDSQITFVADASDRTGRRTGLQSHEGSIVKLHQRIQDVIFMWPTSVDEQKNVFKSDNEVSIL